MKKPNRDITIDILKRIRKENRDEEIRLHGKPIRWYHIANTNKKQYTRKTKHKGDYE